MATKTGATPRVDTPSAPVQRPGRNVELGLLAISLAIGLGAFALVSLRMTEKLPDEFGLVAGVAAAAVLAIHVVLRFKAPYADQVMLPIVVALNGIGLAMIYRINLGGHLTGKDENLAPRQFQWAVVGVMCAALVVVFLRDHRILRKYSYTAMAIGIVLVVLPLVPKLGSSINGAKIWIQLGGFSLQPAEFAKIAFAVFFAGYLVTNRDTLTLAGPKFLGLQFPRIRDLGPILIVWLVSLAVLIFERDLGTSLLFFGLFVAMIYIATERFSWVVIGLVLIAVGAVVAASSLGHVQARFDVWLHPFDPDIFGRKVGGSWQLVGGLFGLANGGLFGTGLGAGYPRLVTYSYSDFIYTSLGEELGLIGLMAILLAYLVFTERGLRTAIGVRDGFGKLLAGGLAFVTAWQLFIVIGGITRIIPLTGLTMPFVAHGGSSLLANWLILGLLLRISDDARRPSALPTRGEIVTGGVRVREEPPADTEQRGAVPDDHPTVVNALNPDTAPTVAGIRPTDLDHQGSAS